VRSNPAGNDESIWVGIFFGFDDDVFHTYSSYASGTESLTDAYRLFDAAPYGRQQHAGYELSAMPQLEIIPETGVVRLLTTLTAPAKICDLREVSRLR
jgi:hypothetical protein